MTEAVVDQDRKQFEKDERLSNLQALRVILRAFKYIQPFRFDIGVKLVLSILATLPYLILAWPVRIITDHVILGVTIGDQPRPFPFFVDPFMRLMASESRMTILFWVVMVQLVFLLVIGQFGTDIVEKDTADAYLASGQDTATSTENAANSGFSLVGGLLGLFDFRWTMRLSQKLNHLYRGKLFERLKSLPLRDFDNERIGDAVYRLMYDTPAVTETCYNLLLPPIVGMISILLTLSVMVEVYGWDSPIIYGALAFGPVTFLVTLPFSPWLRKTSGESRTTGSTTTSTVEEGMVNIIAVQSLGGQARQKKRFDEDSTESFTKYRWFRFAGLFSFGIGWLAAGVLIVFLFMYIGDAVIGGGLSVGDFGVLVAYFSGIAYSAANVGTVWINLQDNAAGLSRVFFLLDRKGETDVPHATVLAPIQKTLWIEDLTFAYDPGTPILEGISLEARMGQYISFVGPAGAGKTTLAYMIPRFLAPTSGRILIDGVDISQVSFESLRSQIAFVFQETVLFDASVEQNIRIGNPEATRQEVREAARMAGADEFIDKMKDGYETRLGRGGGKLSVGQKQRLSIARALVRKAPIMILDEPTSALDSYFEARLVQTLKEASKTRLVLVIAHRLSTVREADQIMFVDKGKILERGTHADLIDLREGPYRHYVELQTPGAL